MADRWEREIVTPKPSPSKPAETKPAPAPSKPEAKRAEPGPPSPAPKSGGKAAPGPESAGRQALPFRGPPVADGARLSDQRVGPGQLMNILTLETTCDETAAAIVTDRLEVLGVRGGLAGRSAPAVRGRGAGDRVSRPRGADPAGHRRGAAPGRDFRWAISMRWRSPTRRGWPARSWWAWWPPRPCAWRWAFRWWPSTTCRPTSTPAGWPAGKRSSPAWV